MLNTRTWHPPTPNHIYTCTKLLMKVLHGLKPLKKKTVLQSFFLVLPFCRSREVSLAMWCSLILRNTDTTNETSWNDGCQRQTVSSKQKNILRSNQLRDWNVFTLIVNWSSIYSCCCYFPFLGGVRSVVSSAPPLSLSGISYSSYNCNGRIKHLPRTQCY